MEENQDLSAIVQDRVDRAVATSSEKLLTDLDALISTRIAGLQVELTQNQSSISSTQLEAINSIKNQHQPTFKRKGNQEQFQFNAKVNTALEEAKSTLESPLTEHSFLRAGSAIVQGMELIKHRQKLIRLADQSEAGWSMVSEYETNELADDSDDEKKITRADSRANRKLKESRVKRSRRQVRFDANSRTAYSAPVTSTRPGQQSTTYQTNSWPKRGLCFACGKPGHYRRECAAVAAAHNKISTGNILAKSIRTSSNLNGPPGNGSTCMYIGGGVSNSSNLPVDPFFGERICQEKIMPGNSSNVSPIGKLRQSYEMWQAASNNAHVLEIINSGYKLPFINTPPVSFCRNNKSALENADFVSSEIENLLGKGCITQVTNIPNVINPLTVACNKGGKLRLVLDCRIINLFLFKFGIKLDGIEVAEQIFQKGDYLFTFDLKSAYHHIEIFHTHRTYLGFAWKQGEETVYYVFNVLPFGLSTAAYIFTKLVRVMVAYWRGQGFRIAMYMDDGCGGSSTKNGALALSNTVQNSISKFGFLIAQDKCFWSPSNTVAWLGHVINTLEGSISVSETRILSLLESINEVVSSIATGVVSIDVRKLARIAGKIISMHTAIGPIVQLKSRYMYNCIETRHSWRGRVIVNTDVFSELLFWKENVRLLNGKVIWRDATCQNAMGQDDRFAMGQEDRFAMGHDGKFAMGHGGRFAMGQDGKCTTLDCGKFTTCQDNDFVMGQNGKCTTRADGKFALTAYSDASNTGYGGYVVDDMNSDVTGLWSFDEQALSSTWRELEAVARVMNANKDCISGHSVKWFTDNQNVARILHVGSQKLHLHDIAVSIYDSCQSLGTEIQAEWIPRELNGRADALSRGGDCDDWGISESAFLFIDHAFGPHSVDRFASEYNTKLPRFNSRWAFRNSEGIDAFAQSWKGENNWLVPPPRLVVSTLRLGLTERVNAALDTSDPDLLRLSRQLPAILVGSRSDNTSRKYWSYFVKWEHFVKDKGLLSALPGNAVHVALYLTNLIENKASISVISSTFYAIKWAHNLAAEQDPTLHPFVINVLECAKRCCSKPINKKEPVNSSDLRDLCVKYIDSQDLLIVRDLTMMLLCFCGFFRYSEIQNLKCNDVVNLGDHLSIGITKSKTDQYRDGSNVLIAKLSDTPACPYSMFLRYVELANIDMASSNFLFRPIIRTKDRCFLSSSHKCLSYSRARDVILGRLREVNVTSNFGIHSLRSGGASAAANCAAVNERCWKRHGRWRSETAKDGYVADSLEKRLRVSQNLGL